MTEVKERNVAEVQHTQDAKNAKMHALPRNLGMCDYFQEGGPETSTYAAQLLSTYGTWGSPGAKTRRKTTSFDVHSYFTDSK